MAYVGTYGVSPDARGGGIFSFHVASGGAALTALGHAAEPKDAGYLLHAPETNTLYAVDERKTDGRGPVDKPAAVHALAIDRETGKLSWLNARIAPGPRPTFLDHHPEKRFLVSANHGDFQHVEKVVQAEDGSWSVEYVYDDSTAILFALEDDGRISGITGLQVLSGRGTDPNSSPQNGGHAQSNPHAHCAVIDPSGNYVLVCDKGTDRILVLDLSPGLNIVSEFKFPPETGARHLAFDKTGRMAFATLEFASELASLRFDPATGELELVERVSTVTAGYRGTNEPAEVRVHPGGGLVYVNNRGEDSLAWFRIEPDGHLTRQGAVTLSPSVHPGLAARSFTFASDGSFLLVADRPADLVRSYSVNPDTGALTWLTQTSVPDPAFIALVELDD
ncbi:lactonase family protein [Stakelama flava]|uniref:lactonase family protein n=1 Tax=Stakelama flava TaxID=2860338 RepID=UPI0031B9EAC4